MRAVIIYFCFVLTDLVNGYKKNNKIVCAMVFMRIAAF